MKHSTPEEDLELGMLLSPQELEPLVVNLDTSTEMGRRWRIRKLEVESEKNYIANMWKKYHSTKNKTYLVAIQNVTGQMDNLPGPDSE